MTERRAVNIGELDVDTRARLLKRPEAIKAGMGASPEPAPTRPKKKKGANGATASSSRRRKETGAGFEADLDMVHTQYEFRQWGRVRRNHIPTKVIGSHHGRGSRVAVGGADVDRTGWVRVQQLRGGVHAQRDSWAGTNAPNGAIIPVAFDAKVLDTDHATYRHSVDQQHQLHALRAAAQAGEYAFLLVLARQVGRIFAVPIVQHFDALLRDGVKLYASASAGDCTPLLPSIPVLCGPLGRDWIPLLQYCAPP